MKKPLPLYFIIILTVYILICLHLLFPGYAGEFSEGAASSCSPAGDVDPADGLSPETGDANK